MTPEGKIKAKVNRALAECKHIWKFMPVQMGMGIPGLDYLLCVRGTFIAIETKVKGKKLTPRQETTRRAIETAGGQVFVVDDEQSLEYAMLIIRHYALYGPQEVARRASRAGE